MHKTFIVVVSLVIVVLCIFGYRGYSKIQDLTDTNQALQQKVTSLERENTTLTNQIKNHTVYQNTDSAKTVATQFVRTFNDISIDGAQRSDQLKELMTTEAFNKQIGSSLKKLPAATNVQSRIEVQNIASTKIGTTEKVIIDYDHIQNGQENYVERMRIVLDMVVFDGKWLVSNYERTYIQGPEGKGVS